MLKLSSTLCSDKIHQAGNVSNIDRTPPSVTASVGSVTYNSAKLTVSASDSQSGIANYKYYLGSTLKATTTTNHYTFTGLSYGNTYTLKVVVTDKVGNTTEKSGTATPTFPATSNTKPFLPPGATVTNPNIETGLSIKDSNGNEWVWIEVPKSIYPSGTTSTNYTAIENAMKSYASAYRQSGYTDTFGSIYQHGFTDATEYNNHKNSMLKSVFENGGFYIGKYETGTNKARFQVGEMTTPMIKRDMYLYNLVNGTEARVLSQKLSVGGRTGSIMFGIQWDLVLKYLEIKKAKTQAMLLNDSTSWGNYYKTSFNISRGQYMLLSDETQTWKTASSYLKPANSSVVLTTGASDRNCVLGIYDLAGNIEEITLESDQSDLNPIIVRGGSSLNQPPNQSASKRMYIHNNNVSARQYSVGFRSTLW